jgi:hypothetical protein
VAAEGGGGVSEEEGIQRMMGSIKVIIVKLWAFFISE